MSNIGRRGNDSNTVWAFFRTETYSTEAFNKFPFNREAAAKVTRLLLTLSDHFLDVLIIPRQPERSHWPNGVIGKMLWVCLMDGRCTFKDIIRTFQHNPLNMDWPPVFPGAHWWISVNFTEEEAVQVSSGPNIPFQIPGSFHIVKWHFCHHTYILIRILRWCVTYEKEGMWLRPHIGANLSNFPTRWSNWPCQFFSGLRGRRNLEKQLGLGKELFGLNGGELYFCLFFVIAASVSWS